MHTNNATEYRNLPLAVLMCLASWFGPLRHFVLAHLWDVEVLGIIHPGSRRGGGNVGIAGKRFPRSVGRVGKQFHRFPMLSIDCQFHRFFRLTSLFRRHRVDGRLFLLFAACSTEAIRLGTCFDDVRLIGKPVEHRLA
jgi:hypothetical protein